MEQRQLIIGLIGLAGSGKSTAAKRLSTQHGFVRRPMAYRLKCMIGALGVESDVLDGDIKVKETPHEALNNLTPRYGMQTLGTEWGRKCMGENFWVDLWKRDAKTLGDIVVDDIRFFNEAKMIHELGGFIIRVERPGAGTRINVAHESEQHFEYLPQDFTIANDGSPLKLYTELDAIVAGLRSGMKKRV